MANDASYKLVDRPSIIEMLEDISPSMVRYINANAFSEFTLYYKFITHSDLSGGKRQKSTDSYEKNILYYLTVEEMERIGTPTDHQSNITIPSGVYKHINIPREKGNVIPFKLVNDSMSYFAEPYTKTIVSNLGKRFRWDGKCGYQVSNGEFTDMTMTFGDHGVGTAADDEFQRLRKNVFMNDIMYCLVETNPNNFKQLFILFEKNPKFYSILKIKNDSWCRYLKQSEEEHQRLIDDGEEAEAKTKVRKLQAKWKLLLAKEMMNYAGSDTEVFCPFTKIRADFNAFSMLFIASHIKRHTDSDIYEKYDQDNGLLLVANADALFDKHMITIDENKNLLFSCLLTGKDQLKEELLLNHEIFIPVLNDRRMKYLAVHRAIFYEKENLRSKEGYVFNEEAEEELDEIDTPMPIQDGSNVQQHYPNGYVFDDWECPQASEESFFVVANETEREKKDDSLLNNMLIGYYKSTAHLRWITTNLKYNIRMGKRIGSQGNDADKIPTAQLLVLYSKDNHKKRLYYTIENGEQLSAENLSALGYPSPNANNSYYVYNLGCEVFGLNIDVDEEIAKATKGAPNYKNGMPIYIKKK